MATVTLFLNKLLIEFSTIFSMFKQHNMSQRFYSTILSDFFSQEIKFFAKQITQIDNEDELTNLMKWFNQIYKNTAMCEQTSKILICFF